MSHATTTTGLRGHAGDSFKSRQLQPEQAYQIPSKTDGLAVFPLFGPNPPLVDKMTTSPPPTLFPTLPPTYSPAQLLYEQQLEAYYHKRVVVISVCTGLIAILCLLLAWILLPPLFRRLRPRLQTKRQHQSLIDARYHTVDAWLITKTVQKHDDDCQWVQHLFGTDKKHQDDDLATKPSSRVLTGQALLQKLGIPDPKVVVVEKENKKTTNQKKLKPIQRTWKILRHQQKKEKQAVEHSNDSPSIQPDDDDDDSHNHNHDLEAASNASQCSILDDSKPSCSICLERFRPGDKVSWSSGEECNHTFHHVCIREWLLRKSACPYCREFVLPVDRPSAEELVKTPNLTHRKLPLTKERVQVCSVERAYRSTTSYFCVECGLVRLQAFARDCKSSTTTAGGQRGGNACRADGPDALTRVSTWKRPWTRMGKTPTLPSTTNQCQDISQQQQSSSLSTTTTFRPQQTVDMSDSSSSSSSYENENDHSSLWSEESDLSWEDDDSEDDSLEDSSDDDDDDGDDLKIDQNNDSSASLGNDAVSSENESDTASQDDTGNGSLAAMESDKVNQN